ncbi:hypothetical protein E9549_00790 [Blastococcus sp. MG754426]|uniref:hypothetical protein n=1 Tax=unclassified Blastococcus TaxID=2619396 RepID=UPI001EF10866|nr:MULTISPECIES: hypothetical protein [unclassified Blastococcus]MCF6505953.1 hypothetical protein [Blastococcus sp. MG754426]MCF6510660.1 hypothetical protein [Blastococcus sp. MG754427]MCF6733935.1 hypothetical protein [Blastococcus sp. KM273129]
MERDSAVVPRGGREALDWTWPPYAPVEVRTADFDTERWASATCVRRPWVRVGRWTLLYRRAA